MTKSIPIRRCLKDFNSLSSFPILYVLLKMEAFANKKLNIWERKLKSEGEQKRFI